VLISKRYILALILALAAIGCSDTTGATSAPPADTSVDSPDDVLFGSGELPETIPDEFPIPQGSAVGSTMVVTKTGFTEVILRISAELGISAEFFNQGLAQAGFTVAASAADAAGGWMIEFSDASSKGTIELTEPVEGISQAVVRYNVP
jgi:hypothetical protein